MSPARRRYGLVGLMLAVAVAAGGAVMARRATATPLVYAVPLGPNASHGSSIAIDTKSGRVFVVDSANLRISVLDARSGAVVASHDLAQMPLAMAVDERARRVLLLGSTPQQYKIDILDDTDGTVLHTTTVGQQAGAIAVDTRSGRAFVANAADDTVSMLDTRSGTVLRTIAVGYYPKAVAVDERGGRVFVADYGSGSVSMLDAASGGLLTTIKVGAGPQAVLVDEHSGRVFVTNGDAGTLSVLDARNGQVVATLRQPNVEPVAVDAAVGRVASLSLYGLTMLDAHSGAVAHATSLGGAVLPYWSQNMAVDARTGRIYVVTTAAFDRNMPTAPGSVYVLDGATGALLRRVPIGWNPGPIAIDEATGRAFVVDEGGPVTMPDPLGWMPAWLRDRLPIGPAPGPQIRTVAAAVSVIDLSH